MHKILLPTLIFLALIASCAAPTKENRDIARGRYVVEIMGCNDCHTPGYMARGSDVAEQDWLVGSDFGYHGSWGTAYPTNLRLMLNEMSEQQWLTLARQMRRDSPMAWIMLPKLTDQDLLAVYHFVRHLGPKGAPAPARLPAGVTPTTRYIEFPEPH